MDILARIEEVIKQRGTNKAEVSEKMGKAKQNFKSLLTNPKWDSLELVCEAMGIQPWQLFEQEIMAAGYRLTAEPEPKDIDNVEHPQAPEPLGKQPSEQAGGDDLPFNNDTEGEQKAEEVKMLRFSYNCPHCGHEVRISIE